MGVFACRLDRIEGAPLATVGGRLLVGSEEQVLAFIGTPVPVPDCDDRPRTTLDDHLAPTLSWDETSRSWRGPALVGP